MLQLPKLADFLPSFSLPGGGIRLPRAAVHDIEERPEKRARTLKHLLKANHINHSIIYNELRFHNHVPHSLSSAYIFGAESDELNTIYEAESKSLEAWKDSPGEIAKHDWRDFLGKREYQRAFIDFFEDQLVQHGYDWRALLTEFLLEGKEPLINNLVSGLGHPLIHLGYAYEMSSRTVAVEALSLAACFYNEWHVYLDDPKYTAPAPNPTDSLFIIMDRVCHDAKFDGFKHRGSDNIDTLLADKTQSAAVLEYWNSWELKNPKDQFAESQKLAVALLVAAQPPEGVQDDKFDFFVVHLLTTSHAIRVLLPLMPSKFHIPLVRQWWLFTLLVYIAQLRPRINIDNIKLVELDGRDWKWVTHKALKGEYRTDAHFVKALRSMHEASKTWSDPNQFFLRAAVKFGEEFDGWGGFDATAATADGPEHLQNLHNMA
nr:questin oxidase [Quercus suber]